MLLPSAGVIIGFAVAVVVAQCVNRRRFFKSLFNFGQILVAAGLGVAASRAAVPRPPASHLDVAMLGAAILCVRDA